MERGRRGGEMILAIDPGDRKSAYVLMHGYDIIEFDKVDNDKMKSIVENIAETYHPTTVIEMVASYGMAVGRTVFETCVWIGRFAEVAEMGGMLDDVKFLYRKDVKMNICGQMKAKDSNITQALIDRFAKHDLKRGKGTKNNKDTFYGFKADIWQAYALGVTYLDTRGVDEWTSI